jgi:8-oxo-dGTP pyrophosphatase MutT (NUDIX family)
MTRYVKLVGQLEHIVPVDEREAGSIVATLDRLTWPEDPFDERVSEHHVTASAFVVSSRGVILLCHRLLGIWVQPGGHIDPGEGPEEAALRETLEETGLAVRHRSPAELFQVDVHPGPHGHTHYDLRYVLVAPPLDPSPSHGESREVYWFDFDAARERCEPALGHVLDKLDRATQRWNVKDFDGG